MTADWQRQHTAATSTSKHTGDSSLIFNKTKQLLSIIGNNYHSTTIYHKNLYSISHPFTGEITLTFLQFTVHAIFRSATSEGSQ